MILVISVALAPVGGLFATGSGDQRVRVWRVSADREGMGNLPPAGPVHHSQTSSQASVTPYSQPKKSPFPQAAPKFTASLPAGAYLPPPPGQREDSPLNDDDVKDEDMERDGA